MWLRKGFIEMLPYSYAVAGVAAVIHFQKFIGYVSGLVLIFLAGMIFLKKILDD